MFRLTRIRMAQWQVARNLGLPGRGLVAPVAIDSGNAQMGSKKDNKKAGGKKDKPNPCQPSKKKEAKPEKPSTFVADNTPAGEKKDCKNVPMLPDYHPKQVEAAWYQWWEKQGYFHANADAAIAGKKAYTMVIPPPNVTGALHLGHALMLTIEDAIMRQKRMAGYETLWLPGVDHAGIATQSVVEK